MSGTLQNVHFNDAPKIIFERDFRNNGGYRPFMVSQKRFVPCSNLSILKRCCLLWIPFSINLSSILSPLRENPLIMDIPRDLNMGKCHTPLDSFLQCIFWKYYAKFRKNMLNNMQKGPETIKFGVIKSLLSCQFLRVFSWPFWAKSMADMNGGGTFLQKMVPPKISIFFM